MSLHTRAAVLSIVAALALMLGVGALSAGSPALETDAGVTVSGHVFYDLNMNGIYELDPSGRWEPGVETVVELRQGSTVKASFTTADREIGYGRYVFENVQAGNYTVAEVGLPGYPLPGKISTSPSEVPITVGPVGSESVNFGVAQKITVKGVVFDDTNDNGASDMGEEIAATVKVIQDTDGDGVMDYGEPLLGQAHTLADGRYLVTDITPGDCILTVVPDLGGYAGAPLPMFLSANPFGEASVADVEYEPSAPVALTGTIWNDVDGDEVIDETGEPGLQGVKVEVYGAVGGTAYGDPPITWAWSGPDGSYLINGLSAGWLYQVKPVEATLPVGSTWLMSNDPDTLFVTVADPGPNVVNVGYFNALAPAPLRQSDWKKELKQAGKPRYTPAQLDGFIASAEAASGVFAEVVGIREVLTKSPISGEWGHALKEHAALRLNLASNRLYAATPIRLPELTTAQTVGAAVAEIEGILAPGRTPVPTKEEYQHARRLAETLNAGKGLGAGRPGVFSIASATYRGAPVYSKLRPGGDLVDLATDAPTYLLKWSSGTLDPAINVVQPKLRVKVKVFMDGGVLDVVQVLPDGRTQLLGTVVPPVWNKDVNATYLFDVRGVSTGGELISSEFRFITRDVNSDGKVGRSKIDSAELVFTY